MARLASAVRIAATWLLLAAAANAAAINIGPVSHFFGNNSFAGGADGTGLAALLNTPNGCMLDNGNNFYLADTVNHVVRRVASGTQTTTSWIGLIGTPGNVPGTGTAIRVQSPTDLVLSNDGTNAYVVDYALNSIFTASINVPTTTSLYVGDVGGLAGNVDGTGTAARLNGPWGIALKTGSNVELYITERNGHRVRKIVNAATTIFAGSVSNVNGSTDANGTAALFNSPRGIAVQQSSGRLFVADADNRKVRAISSLGVVTTLAGDGVFGNNDGVGTAARFVQPWGVVVDKAGRFLYISDKGNNVIRRLTLATNAVNTVFGRLDNGWNVSTSSVVAELAAPAGVCLQFAGATQRLYVTGDHSVAYATTRHTITATVPAPPGPSTTTTTGASGPTTTGISGTPTPTGNSTPAPLTTNPNSTTPSINAAPSLPTILVALTTIAALLVA